MKELNQENIHNFKLKILTILMYGILLVSAFK